MKRDNKAFTINLIMFSFIAAAYTFIFASYFELAINLTDSLPQKVFIVHKRKMPSSYDQFFVYELPCAQRFKDKKFIKHVGGFAGDLVTEKDNKYYVNGKFIGLAKTSDMHGLPVEKQQTGIIPENHYFAYSNHKDSYDSRYKEVGFINADNVIGVAYAIF
jgi:conjugal transfer pilin signal peptidase TrbI